ncbi:MAG: hypothetical protein ACI4IF_00810 [Acutalibacteraceae bacterium]
MDIHAIIKKVIFIVVFVVAALVLPAFIMLHFIDASSYFSVYVVVYGVILFSILGYIIITVRNMENKLKDALEEIKMQNAAIAFKLTGNNAQVDEVSETKVTESTPPVVDTSTIPLNPPDPLVMPENKKKSDENFDDFQ